MPDEEKNMMRVIVCKPDEYAEVVEIEDSLESMQNMVGGLIEEYMPWDDEVAIICNAYPFEMCSEDMPCR